MVQIPIASLSIFSAFLVTNGSLSLFSFPLLVSLSLGMVVGSYSLFFVVVLVEIIVIFVLLLLFSIT